MVWTFCKTGRPIEEGGATIGCHRRDASLVFIRQRCQAGLGEMKGNKRDEQRGGKG